MTEAGRSGSNKGTGHMKIERQKGCDMEERGEDAQQELEEVAASGNGEGRHS